VFWRIVTAIFLTTDHTDCTDRACAKSVPPYIGSGGESFGRVFGLTADFFGKFFLLVKRIADESDIRSCIPVINSVVFSNVAYRQHGFLPML
jgi:hypothetical protein